jgi:heterodisulfide reductase subunit A-like polyferredoxin
MQPSFPTLLILLSYVHSALTHDTQYDRSKFEPEDNIVRDVAIIPGGSSGTHAAISLKDKGKSIGVVEQKARLGGHTENTPTQPSIYLKGMAS